MPQPPLLCEEGNDDGVGAIPLSEASTYLTNRKGQFEIGGDLDSVIIPLLAEEGWLRHQ